MDFQTKTHKAFLLIALCLVLSSCVPRDDRAQLDSQIQTSSSYDELENKLKDDDLSWLILEQGNNYEISLPQINTKQNCPVAQSINDEIRELFYTEANNVIKHSANATNNGIYTIKMYATQVNDYLNFMIVQAGTDPHSDGKAYCVAYSVVTGQRHTLGQALNQDDVTQTKMNGAVINHYLASNPTVTPEDITSISPVDVVVGEAGVNEYIYQLSALGSDGFEYQHIIGYIPQNDLIKTFDEYAKLLDQSKIGTSYKRMDH